MATTKYGELRQHIGHHIECACYGKENETPQNIALECIDCGMVLLDFERPENTAFCAPCDAVEYIDSDGECVVCGTVIKK
jgi:hypothetical protein